MNRQDYKIKVESKKEAKRFKQMLLAIGENVSSYYWEDIHDIEKQNELVYEGGSWLCDYDSDGKEITFKELLTLIVNDEKEVKPGLLDGKCAIQVTNEREFKLLMEHYNSKGWKSNSGDSPTDFPYWYNYINYGDKFFHNTLKNFEFSEHKIIPFKDFAAEVGIKVPVFVMKSEDGVYLYEGDYQYVANQHEDNQWFLLTNCRPIMKGDETPTWLRVFSTKEAAEKWIEEQNKPKEISLSNMPNLGIKVFAVKDGIRIGKGFHSNVYKVEEVKDWLTAWKSLQD